VFMELNVLN